MRQREQERQRGTGAPPNGEGLAALEPVVDASKLARQAAAGAASVDAEPAGIEVAIRTTTSRTGEVVHVVATPDTTVSELMNEACSRLEVADRDRYLLVANGEVLAEGERTLGDVVSETEATGLDMRLVRKPEAGDFAQVDQVQVDDEASVYWVAGCLDLGLLQPGSSEVRC